MLGNEPLRFESSLASSGRQSTEGRKGHLQDSTMLVNAFSCLSRSAKRWRMSASQSCAVEAMVMCGVVWCGVLGCCVLEVIKDSEVERDGATQQPRPERREAKPKFDSRSRVEQLSCLCSQLRPPPPQQEWIRLLFWVALRGMLNWLVRSFIITQVSIRGRDHASPFITTNSITTLVSLLFLRPRLRFRFAASADCHSHSSFPQFMIPLCPV